MAEQISEVRRVGKRGLVTIPKRFWRALGLDGDIGAYVRIEQIDEREIRITPDTREAWWRAQAIGSTVAKEGRQRAGTKGAEEFVRECLAYYARGRVATVEVQRQYQAWLAVRGGEVPATSPTHLGRAVRKVISQVRRSRMIDQDGAGQPVYLNLAFREKPQESGRPDEGPEERGGSDSE